MKRYLPHPNESPIAWYRCQTRECDCMMVKCEIVEDYVRDAMEEWLQNYILQIEADHQPKADLLRQHGEGKQKKQATVQIIPTSQHILDNYDALTIAEKNRLWKLVMLKATVYRSPDNELTVNIYPNLPK